MCDQVNSIIILFLEKLIKNRNKFFLQNIYSIKNSKKKMTSSNTF